MGLKDPHLKSNSQKKKNQSENITIDAKHNDMLKYFHNLQRSIPEKRRELKSLQDRLIEISSLENSDFDFELLILKDSLDDKINQLQIEIQDILDKKEENNYYLKVGNLLSDYYENIEQSNNNKMKEFVKLLDVFNDTQKRFERLGCVVDVNEMVEPTFEQIPDEYYEYTDDKTTKYILTFSVYEKYYMPMVQQIHRLCSEEVKNKYDPSKLEVPQNSGRYMCIIS